MLSGSPYSLVNEMLETPGILRRFDPAQTAGWRASIAGKKRLFLAGEGASRIFPAKNMISIALQRGMPWQIHTEGARQAAEYDLSRFTVIGASNSGRTRELISLFEKLGQRRIVRYGVTAAAGSRLAEVADECLQFSCGAEKAVAATKSAVEQALVFQSLLGGEEWRHQGEAAAHCEEVLTGNIAPEITQCLKSASLVYFSGRNDGVAEELALKTNEILRKKSAYLEGTYALHGIEEVMDRSEAIVLVEPFREEIEKYRDVLAQRVGIKVIAISSCETPFPTVKVPAMEGFNGYIRLLAGWNMLVAAALANGINPDKTERARKVGNEV